jgi:hypothetical protein
MSMGWSLISFDFGVWRRWTGGSLTSAQHESLREAALWEVDWLTEAEVRVMEGAVAHVAADGLELAYRDGGTSLAALDSLVCRLFTPEGMADQLQCRGLLDPWGWNAIGALVGRVGPQSAAQLLLTGRRVGTGLLPNPADGGTYVIFQSSESHVLAADLTVAMRRGLDSVADWESSSFLDAMTELEAEAARGRGVFAHDG